MRLKFWGVRGSVAAPEANYQRFGGNTPCVELRLDAHRSLLLDAGLGLRWQALDMLSRQGVGNELEILLSHCHWDHIQGIPFSPMMYIPGNRILIRGVGQPPRSLLDNLVEQLRPEFCPVPNFLTQRVGADIEVRQFGPEPTSDSNGLTIHHAHLPRCRSPHPVVGYRIEFKGLTLAYLTDVEYAGSPADCSEALQLARGADVLIHDAQLLPEERRRPSAAGHSSYLEALELARLAGVRRLFGFHHDPTRNDEQLEQLEELLKRQSSCPAELAREGQELELTS